MTRNVAMIITAVVVLCCACPGFLSICSGLSIFAMPDAAAQQGVPADQAMFIGVGYLCGGLISIIIAAVAAFVSFRMVKPEAAANVPPAA